MGALSGGIENQKMLFQLKNIIQLHGWCSFCSIIHWPRFENLSENGLIGNPDVEIDKFRHS
jgi:hypothetical protein